MELTRKQAEQLKKDAQRALDSMEKGMTAQEAAAELYVRAMPGKDREAGLAAAQRIERIVTEYALLSGEARRDPDGWIDCRLDALGEGLDCAQRCAVLMQLLGEVMAVQRGEAAPQDGFDAAQASEELEAELRGRIRQALECSTLGAAELDSLQQAMQQMQCGGTRRFADFGAQRHDICVVEGMLAYIAAQERAEEVTPEEAAVSVCLAQDAKRVLMDAAEGVLTEEEAARTMAMVGRAAHMLSTRGVGGAASLALNVALLPVCPTFIRKPVAMVAGNLVSLVVEHTAGPLVEGAVRCGWRVVERSDGQWAQRLQRLCHEQQENLIPQCERGLDMLEHPIASLWERIRSSRTASAGQVNA
ncbi:MAG: hypothetical protein SPE01_02950 [Candidatus Spyradocola sp.]|nr:hypothetical protein [Candidatus Spyradocola sp.]